MIIDLMKTAVEQEMDKVAEVDLPLNSGEQFTFSFASSYISNNINVGTCVQTFHQAGNTYTYTYGNTSFYAIDFDFETGNVSWDLVSWNVSSPEE